MKSSNLGLRICSALMLMTLVLGSIQGGALAAPTKPAGQLAQPPVQQPAQQPANQPSSSNPPPQVESASDVSLGKLDDDLINFARTGGDEAVDVRLVVTGNDQVDWQGLVQAVPRAEPDAATDLPVWYGKVKARDLAKMASLGFVVHADAINKDNVVPRYRDPDQSAPVVTDDMRARLRELRDNPLQNPHAPVTQGGWWDIGPGHESKAAWDKGYTGSGVRVADLDSGVDFCHPDLYGTWATYDVTTSRNITYTVYTPYPYEPVSVPNYYSYYDGWPLALSPFSNYALFFDLYYNGAPTDANTFAYGFSKFADTRATGVGSTITFGGKVYTTTGTASIFTPVYHIGYHPDTSLENFWWGERIAVLVVDEDGDGVYETVYVDLNDNHDFSDDKPASQADPVACWDANGDGYYDLSGGMVYFIADGKHWPQMMDWWWSPSSFGLAVPGAGELVAFMFDDPLGPAAAHGTLTAGNIVGQGVADGDPSIYGGIPRPSFKPTGVGGMVQGGGKNASLIAIGDIYINFTASTEEGWYFASMGVDGYGDTDDGAQITSNSYGESATDNDEWDNRARLLTRLNTRTTYRGFPAIYNQQVAHLVSTGNGAPGFGTVTAPGGSTAIHIGASTQFGSTGDFDSISGADQIVWGDVIPWSNRGPTAVGHLAPSVTADGAFAAGDITSNGWGDGWTAWTSWGGTSRSSPVAAGNLALIYQAWKQGSGAGQWPTWQQARELIMNGATDQQYDVLVQGAGAVNADAATDIAGGLDGLHVSPDSWYPGYSPGASGEPIAFAQVITPGGVDSQVFTVKNYSTTITITAPLTATYLTRISEFTLTLALTTSNESPYSFTRPDYLWNVSRYAPSGVIPADTDLMVAEITNPFDQFEPQGDDSASNNSVWRVLWYSSKDVNGDGNLWTDANGNGAVNDGEIDSGEYIRLAYGYGVNNYKQVSVKDPLGRWKDGIYLGLQHRQRTSAVPNTNLTIRVSFFKKSPWNWLSFDASSVTAGPSGTANFTATMSVPADTPYGLYEGAIEVEVPGHTTIIPVVANVAFSGDLTASPVTLGGQPKANTRYDNSHVVGAQDWSWRAESGDWRFYFLSQNVTPTVGTRLVVKDVWGDTAPETDIDTLILGPTSGAYTRSQAPFLFNFGDFSATDPATFGPYRLDVKAKSANQNVGAGIWLFDTATGGNVEYVVAPLSNGLHEILQHSVRWEGDEIDVPFTKTVSTLTGPTALTYANYFTDVLSFAANITHTNGITVEVYGLSETRMDFADEEINQDPTNGDYCDFDAGGIYTYTTTLTGNVAKFVAHVSVGSNDLDLFLLYDSDSDGAFVCPDDTIASSTRSAGSDDEVTVNFPAAGDYMVVIQGWSVSPDPSLFDWYWTRTDLDSSLGYRNADLTINPSKPATFELYNVSPSACSDAAAACNDGIIYVGFPDAPRLFSVPITVNYSAPDLSTSTKKVSASTAIVGEVLTYTITLTNTNAITATGALVTDTLPSAVTFGGLVSGGATYSGTLNAVLWSGDVVSGTAQTIVYTVTVKSNVANGTIIANTADINNGLGNIFTTAAANTTVQSVNLSTSTKAVDKTAASPGDTLTYTLVVKNTGPVTATSALLVDVLPQYTQFITATGGAVPMHVLGAVLTGASEVPPVTDTVGTGQMTFFYDPVSQLLTYQGQVSGLTGNVTAAHIHTGTVGVGGGVLYPLAYTAIPNGAIFYGALVLLDPAHASALLSGGLYANVHTAAHTGGEIRGQIIPVALSGAVGWVGPVAAGGAYTVTYQAKVVSPLATGTLITNTAQTSDGLGTLWNTNVVTTTISSADLSASTKSASATRVSVGDVVTFTVVVRNTGDAATSATMVDALPASLTLTGTPTVSGPGSIISSGNTVTWTGTVDADPFGANQQATIRLNAMVNSLTLCQTITNAAAISDNQGNTAAPSVTLVDAACVRSVSATPATTANNSRPGFTVTYLLTITNTGNYTDTFDVSVSRSGAAFTTTAPATVGPLAAGAGKTISVTVDVPSTAALGAVSTATLTLTSQADPTATTTVVLTTTAAEYKVYMPIINR